MTTPKGTTLDVTTTVTDITTKKEDQCDYYGQCPNGKECILGICENIPTTIPTTSITTQDVASSTTTSQCLIDNDCPKGQECIFQYGYSGGNNNNWYYK